VNPPSGLPGLDPTWSRTITVPDLDGVGRTFHVLDRGTADATVTLLCVHGNPTWSYLFRDLIARAPDDVRVVAVDHLDMGFSERTGTTRHLATRVDDLTAIVDRIGIDGPIVTVAHDWGGPISLGWAIGHRDRLAGVVLMNTAVHQPAGARAPAVIRLVRSRPFLRPITTRTDTFVRGALAMVDHRIPADVRAGYLAAYRTADRRRAIGDFVADIPLDPDHPSAVTLDAIAEGVSVLGDVPTLLVWGARDPVFSDRYLHDLERRFPHAVVHRHPRAGHLVSEDVDVFGAVLDFVAGPIGTRRPGGATDETSSTLARFTDHPPDRTAIVESAPRRRFGRHRFGRRRSFRTSFAELDHRTEVAARALLDAGVRRGERVASMIPPGVDLAAVVGAVWRIGGVVVLVDAGLGPRPMSAAMRSADPAHLVGVPAALAASRVLRWPGRRHDVRRLVGTASTAGSAGADPTPPNRDDPAAVVFTSGATGPSKGVRYTHRQLEAQRDALVAQYRITGTDRLVAAFAPFALYGPVMGITSVVPDMDVTAPGTLTASALGDAADAVDATLVFASPAALANVVRTASSLTERHRRALAGVRLLLSAGAPVRSSLLRDAAALFPGASIHTPYGMTECLPVTDIDLDGITAAEHDGTARGDGVCVGRPVTGVEIRIRPIDGSDRHPHRIGEIVVRAPHARAGYDRLWHTEFAASPDETWHATGDVGHLDTEGRLWVGGRLGHVMATAAGPIAPVAAEQAIERIDGVTAAAVVGVGPDGDRRPVVVVERDRPARRPGPAPTDLVIRIRSAVREVLAPLDGAPDVVAVLEVPRLPVDRRHNSKVDRSRLARWAERVLAGERPGAP
jgi:acyl-coenzyme A synthetase/AMP-(fatty) acid ligase/pimeloyl-ACP methyl ester carboxylesterase